MGKRYLFSCEAFATTFSLQGVLYAFLSLLVVQKTTIECQIVFVLCLRLPSSDSMVARSSSFNCARRNRKWCTDRNTFLFFLRFPDSLPIPTRSALSIRIHTRIYISKNRSENTRESPTVGKHTKNLFRKWKDIDSLTGD